MPNLDSEHCCKSKMGVAVPKVQSVQIWGREATNLTLFHAYTYTLTQATLHFRHGSAGAGWGRAQEPGLTFPAARTTVPPSPSHNTSLSVRSSPPILSPLSYHVGN